MQYCCCCCCCCGGDVDCDVAIAAAAAAPRLQRRRQVHCCKFITTPIGVVINLPVNARSAVLDRLHATLVFPPTLVRCHYFALVWGARYGDERVDLSVRSLLSQIIRLNFTKFSVRVNYGHRSDDSAICYVLPVLWKTSYLSIMGHMARCGGECGQVRCLELPCYDRPM